MAEIKMKGAPMPLSKNIPITLRHARILTGSDDEDVVVLNIQTWRDIAGRKFSRIILPREDLEKGLYQELLNEKVLRIEPSSVEYASVEFYIRAFTADADFALGKYPVVKTFEKESVYLEGDERQL